DLEVMIVLGIGDRGLQTLLDVDSDSLARELQVGERGGSLPAADQLRDKIELLRAHPQHAGDRLGLVIREAPFAVWFAHNLVLKPNALSLLGFLVARMAVEGPGRRKLAELVTDHFLVDRNRHMLLAVVDTEGETDELRQDRRASAPDLDDVMTAGRAGGICLLEQRTLDERAFPD